MTDAQISGLFLLGLVVFIACVIWISRRSRTRLIERGFHTPGVVLATRFRGGGEGGGSWWSEVRFTDIDGVERTRWLGGRYEGDVEVVHHPKRWKRAVIAEGRAVDTRAQWIRRGVPAVIVVFFASIFGIGVLLSTGLWSPRIGEPRLGAICAGAGSSQHTPYGEGAGPSGVVAFDVLDGNVVDIGLDQSLAWNSRSRPWDAELVMCMERAITTFVTTCEYRGLGGNQDRSLALYDATYEVTLREAHTAEVLDVGLQTAQSDRQCPFVANFADSDPDPKRRYATRIGGIQSFLLPYVE